MLDVVSPTGKTKGTIKDLVSVFKTEIVGKIWGATVTEEERNDKGKYFTKVLAASLMTVAGTAALLIPVTLLPLAAIGDVIQENSHTRSILRKVPQGLHSAWYWPAEEPSALTQYVVKNPEKGLFLLSSAGQNELIAHMPTINPHLPNLLLKSAGASIVVLGSAALRLPVAMAKDIVGAKN